MTTLVKPRSLFIGLSLLWLLAIWLSLALGPVSLPLMVAVTFAPVPSFAKFESLAQLHPFPWLREPKDGNIQSFSAWQKIQK